MMHHLQMRELRACMHARQPTSTHHSPPIITTHQHHPPTHATVTRPLTRISALFNPGVRRQPRQPEECGGRAASAEELAMCGLGCRCGADVVCMCIHMVCVGVCVACVHSVLRLSWMCGRLMMLLMRVLCGAGLEPIWQRHMDKVSSAAQGGPGWTAAQYLQTVDQLLKSENNAVLMGDLKVALGEDGPGAVQAMVQAGLLGVRPPSRACLHAPLRDIRDSTQLSCSSASTPLPVLLALCFAHQPPCRADSRCCCCKKVNEHAHRAVHAGWARDIPQEAYRDERGVTLITAASMAHLYCMRLEFGDGRAQAMLDALQPWWYRLVKPVSSG